MDGPIFVAGHRGMVGSAIVRALQARGHTGILVRDRRELDLGDRAAVRAFFQRERPQMVYVAAARVGGILANDSYPADFIHDNLALELNLIDEAHRAGVPRLLFLGSSCIYPKHAPQPMREEHLLTGPLEPTNRAYAIAKIAGIEMANAYRRQHGRDYRSVMPTNLYGPGDNFDLNASHVIPALLRKFHEAAAANAPEATVWGTGKPRREFLHVDDLAEACLHLAAVPAADWQLAAPDGFVNVGVGQDLTIEELARLVARVTGFQGRLRFDADKPDGTPRKLLDVSRAHHLGWRARQPLEAGLREVYAWFREHLSRQDLRA